MMVVARGSGGEIHSAECVVPSNVWFHASTPCFGAVPRTCSFFRLPSCFEQLSLDELDVVHAGPSCNCCSLPARFAITQPPTESRPRTRRRAGHSRRATRGGARLPQRAREKASRAKSAGAPPPAPPSRRASCREPSFTTFARSSPQAAEFEPRGLEMSKIFFACGGLASGGACGGPPPLIPTPPRTHTPVGPWGPCRPRALRPDSGGDLVACHSQYG